MRFSAPGRAETLMAIGGRAALCHNGANTASRIAALILPVAISRTRVNAGGNMQARDTIRVIAVIPVTAGGNYIYCHVYYQAGSITMYYHIHNVKVFLIFFRFFLDLPLDKPIIMDYNI
mgnify:FL=1